MRVPVTVVLIAARACFVVQLVLGLTFWTGNALTLIPVHILVGLLLVLCLWTVAAFTLVARTGPVRAGVAAVWGVGVILLGLNQGRLVAGDLHWLIQVLHLVVGVATIAQVEVLARRLAVASHPAQARLAG